MTPLAEAVRTELHARIAFQEGTIKTWSAAGSRPATIEVTARSHSGFAWFDIAVCRVLLGDSPAAADAFVRAAHAMRSSLEVMTPRSLGTYSATLESAVLSGDRALASDIAAHPVDPEARPSLVGDRLAWAVALPALIVGDNVRARAAAGHARAFPEKKAWYPGIGDAIDAVVDRDAKRLEGAFRRILTKHAAYARNRRSHCFNSGPCLICVPVVVLARIARPVATTIDEMGERRATIPFILPHSQAGAATDIEVDFVPELLLNA